MIKRILLITLALLMILIPSVSVFAESDIQRVYDQSQHPMSEEKISALNEKFKKISEEYDCEIIAVKVDHLGSDPERTAKNLLNTHFISNNMDSDVSGACLVISMQSRKYGIYITEKATKVIKENELNKIEEAVKDCLSDGNVYGAFETFADECETALKVRVRFIWILIALGVGIAVAFIVVLIMKSQLKSVRYQPAANNYVKKGSFNINLSRDIFLYSTIVRRPKPKQNTSSRSSSSGSGRSGSF